jgi:selenocysteine lyase/cysteine desulfurase
VYPWLRAEAAGGPELRVVDVPGGRLTPDALRDAVDNDTVAIAVSLVDFQTGYRVDLDELAELRQEALLVVDGVQALGAVAQLLGPADLLVAGGQKFLRAGPGGGIVAASWHALEQLEPTLSGWWGVEDPFEFDDPVPHELRADAERLHLGSPAIGGAVAAAAAIEVIEIAGIDAIEAAILDTGRAVEATLDESGAEVLRPWRSDRERAGIVSFRLPGESSATTHQRLLDAGVVCSKRGDWVRASFHATTSDAVTGMLAESL